jgi:hypothetical protein
LFKNGIKDTDPGTPATFIMREAPDRFTKYTGDFINGQITGKGVKTWSTGKYYEGEFLEGEMHGQGKLVYNDNSIRCKDNCYEGSFSLNSREGHGRLTKKDGTIIEGVFENNQPTGVAKINFSTGDYYEGDVIKGVMTG